MRIAFRFRWIPFLAALLLVALGVALGRWQQGRAEQKRALAAHFEAGRHRAPLTLEPRARTQGRSAAETAAEARDAAALEWRRVRVSGRFVPDWALYLDNRPYRGRAGFYLLMPFKIAGSERYVLVERGWLPRDPADRARIAPYATPPGQVTLEGVVRLKPGQVMQLGAAPPPRPGAILQNADPARVAAASGLALLPFVLEQAAPPGTADDGLVRDWPAPDLGVGQHRGYAFQWYALALMAFLFFVLTGFRRASK